MFFGERDDPHFHALYGAHEAVINIQTLGVMKGSLPQRALRLVLEWTAKCQEQMMEDWHLCTANQTPVPIEPLD